MFFSGTLNVLFIFRHPSVMCLLHRCCSNKSHPARNKILNSSYTSLGKWLALSQNTLKSLNKSWKPIKMNLKTTRFGTEKTQASSFPTETTWGFKLSARKDKRALFRIVFTSFKTRTCFYFSCPAEPTDADWYKSPAVLLESSEVSGEHVSGQVEVFKGVEGDVSVVDHGQHHRDVSTLVGQELDGSQVGDGAVETERPHGGNQSLLSDSRERQLNASVSRCCTWIDSQLWGTFQYYITFYWPNNHFKIINRSISWLRLY